MRFASLISVLAVAWLLPNPGVAQDADLPEGVVVSRGEASIRFVDIDARLSRIPADKRRPPKQPGERVSTRTRWSRLISLCLPTKCWQGAT